jgi:uncharacterized phage-associated protein
MPIRHTVPGAARQRRSATVYGEPLFREKIEAWTQGPVVRALFARHRAKYAVAEVPEGDARIAATHPTAPTAIAVRLARFNSWTGAQLRELTHREGPWLDARAGLGPHEASNREITIESIRTYYCGIARVVGEGQEDDTEDLLLAEPQ